MPIGSSRSRSVRGHRHRAAHLRADLGVTKSHSRPRASDGDAFSEAQFRCIEDARNFCRTFFPRSNQEHWHSGIALLIPSVVDHDRADEFIASRTLVLFIPLPDAAWINKPQQEVEARR